VFYLSKCTEKYYWLQNSSKVGTTQPILFASTKIMHRPRSDWFLHFHIMDTYQIRTEKWNASILRLLHATLLERWPQVCRDQITFKLLPKNVCVSIRTNWMKCYDNGVRMNTHVRSNKTQPCLKSFVHSASDKEDLTKTKLVVQIFIISQKIFDQANIFQFSI